MRNVSRAARFSLRGTGSCLPARPTIRITARAEARGSEGHDDRTVLAATLLYSPRPCRRGVESHSQAPGCHFDSQGLSDRRRRPIAGKQRGGVSVRVWRRGLHWFSALNDRPTPSTGGHTV